VISIVETRPIPRSRCGGAPWPDGASGESETSTVRLDADWMLSAAAISTPRCAWMGSL
jgi:hypothetical protein